VEGKEEVEAGRNEREPASLNAPEESRADGFRRVVDDWNERGLPAIESRWHEDVVWEEPDAFPDSGTHRGRDAVFSRIRERFEFLGVVSLEVVDVEEIGERRLYSEVIVRGRGPTSGAPAEQHEFWVYEYAEDGRLIRWREFLDRDEALAAARSLSP
jgi:ketosteroid isomerase-like protein